jgi:hypothetical protein
LDWKDSLHARGSLSGVSWEAPDEASYTQWPPVEAGAVPRRSRRRVAGMTAGSLGATLLLTVLCGWSVILTTRGTDHDPNRDSSKVAPTLDPPTGSPFSGHYNAPADLCHDADFTQMRPLFTDHDRNEAISTTAIGQGEVRICQGTTGNTAVSGQFRLTATVYPSEAGAWHAYVAVLNSQPGTVVAGLGHEAYSFRDPQYGLTVISLDANLVLAMSWRDDAQPAVDPEGLARTLIEMCRSNLRLLQAN